MDASGAMEFDKIKKGTVMDDDFKLDKDQRRRANACLDQVIDDAEWASYAIIWQRDEIARLRALVERRERQIVWCVRHGAAEGYDGNSWPAIWYSSTETHRQVTTSREAMLSFDGTDASLLAAVDEATGQK